jgi:hypothetical protein
VDSLASPFTESKDLVFPSATELLGAPGVARFETWEPSNSANARDAENVGEGRKAADIHQSFMKSPQHRANILDPDMDSAGIGVADRNGQLYAVEDFSKAN